jgi:hypothetical protein
MSDIDELAQLRDFGTALRDYLTTLTPPPEYAAAASELAGLASELIGEADGPLRIGVVGEFSSGKSLLLGVLLNDPSLLPTSPHPTTGNVTELRFSRDAGDRDAEDRDAGDRDAEDRDAGSQSAEIRYFGRDDLAALDSRLMDELRATAARLRVPEPGDAADDIPGDIPGDPALTAWCAQLWRSPDPAARKLIRELLHTRAALAGGAALLGTTRTVDRQRLRDVLQIPRVNDPDAFPQVPAPGWTLPATGHPAWAFPLIDRVRLDVRVPSGVWDLASLPPECEFVLLDFPGVGGGLTHVRDLYLTQRGLRDVHTVLVMVDSEKPGGRAADAFYGFLRELTSHNDDPGPVPDGLDEPLAGRLLYCATRFDLLKPPGEAELSAGPGTAGITEQELLGQSEPLWSLLQSGHRPGASSMSAMLSSVTAIAAAGLTPVPPDLDLRHHAGNALAQARRWRTIADALTEGGTGRDLASALRDYAQDGGIARLRSLLERHVTEHGLGQRLSRMRELVTAIEQRKAGLVASLQSHTASRGTAADDPAVAASRLLNGLSSYNIRYQRLLPRLRDPAMIEISPRWSLRDDVAQRAAQLVIEWKQWADILACVEGDVIVSPSDAGQDVDDEDEYGLPPIRRHEQHVPQTTEDFTAVFAATCRELRGYAQERAFEGLRGWLRQRHIDGLDLRRQVDRTISPEAWRRLASTKPLESIGFAIDELLEPDRLFDATAGYVTKQLQRENGDGQQQVLPGFTGRFPLRRDQVLPWSAEAAGDEASRHLVRMLRMRSVFVASVTEIALSDLDDLQYRIYDRLRRLNRRVELPGNAQHEAFVAAVAGEDRTRRLTFTDHATALDAIRPPSAGWKTWRP